MVGILLAMFLSTPSNQGDIRSLLSAQGFEWTLKKADSQIEHIGDIKQGRRSYSIYLYSGINRESQHGINLFIVIQDGVTYLGVYDSVLSHDCHVRWQTVICKTDYPGNKIQFTNRGPPREIWIDGAINPFTFAPKFRAQHPLPR